VTTVIATPVLFASADFVKLTFAFDPWLIAAAKAVPGARIASGGWLIPRAGFPAFVLAVGAAAVKADDSLAEIMPPDPFANAKPTEVLGDFHPRRPTWAQLHTPFGLTAQDYQATGSCFLIKTPNALLLDEMGLGKTSQLINAVSYVFEHQPAPMRPMKVLIVAKASSVTNWRNEIDTFSRPCSVTILRGTRPQRHKLLNDNPPVELGYAALQYTVVSWQGMRIDLDMLTQHSWDWIVLDEAHLAKSTPLNDDQSKQAIAIHSLHAPRKTAMTGTFVINAPQDAWNVLRWLNIEHRSWHDFERETLKTISYSPGKNEAFTLKMVVGYQPTGLAKLRAMIGSSMIRRTKDEEMPGLPPYIRTTVEVIMNDDETARYRAAEHDFLLYLSDKTETDTIDVMTMALRLRQTTSDVSTFSGKEKASSKLLTVESLVEDLDASGQKVLIGTVFVDTALAAARLLTPYKPAVVQGSTPMAQRDREVARFQNDPSCKVFIASVAACREAINLTAASAIIHIDKEWSQAYVDQFEARARRIGSEKHSCINVYTLMAHLSDGKKTIDYGLEVLLAKKERIAAQLTGSR